MATTVSDKTISSCWYSIPREHTLGLRDSRSLGGTLAVKQVRKIAQLGVQLGIGVLYGASRSETIQTEDLVQNKRTSKATVP